MKCVWGGGMFACKGVLRGCTPGLRLDVVVVVVDENSWLSDSHSDMRADEDEGIDDSLSLSGAVVEGNGDVLVRLFRFGLRRRWGRMVDAVRRFILVLFASCTLEWELYLRVLRLLQF